MKKICTIFCMLVIFISTLLCVNVKNVEAESADKKFDVKAAYLLDYDSGTVLYEQNALQHLPVASMVKLMTIFLTFEEIEAGNLSIDDTVTTSENASGMGGSQVFIDPYVDYKVEDLLKSVIIASANDASVALAEKICGTESAFVERMNKRAKELGMPNTNYVNCTGLPAPMQYSCARDIATLDRCLIAFKDYFKYSTIWMDTLVHPSGRKTELVNTNKLIRYFKGCDCGKTGSTDEAGYCLTASAKKGDMRLIGTVIGAKDSKSRFNETSSLLNYGFANFVKTKIVNSGDVASDIPVRLSQSKSVGVAFEKDYNVITKKGAAPSVEVKLEIPESVKAPIQRGEILGKALIIVDGEIVEEIALKSVENVGKLSFGQAFSEIVDNWAFWGLK